MFMTGNFRLHIPVDQPVSVQRQLPPARILACEPMVLGLKSFSRSLTMIEYLDVTKLVKLKNVHLVQF